MNMSKQHAPVEIDQAPTDAYRWAILAGHAVVFLYLIQSKVLTILTKDVEPLCWPYLQSCRRFRFDTPDSTIILLFVQALLILLAANELAAHRHRTFWAITVTLNVYLFSIISLDYRFRLNEYYMLLCLNAVFLFWPKKRWAIPLILVSFYFWAGTLKFNYEWLSGAALYHDLWLIPQRFDRVACAYVVTLETIFVWGLLARRAWVRWLTLGQFALFHLESISQVGWFYPLLMATFLSWFVIEWITKASRIASLADVWRGRAPGSAYVLLGIFSCFQLLPYLYRGDKVLTGQGRIFALHMVEARQVCDVTALTHYSDQTSTTIDLLLRGLPARTICDPMVYYDRMTNLCQMYSADPRFVDADFIMHVRRTTDAILSTVVDDARFCSKHEVYRMFSNNTWIR